MEPEGSLPHSQQPATCPYPEPDLISPCPHIPHPEELFFSHHTCYMPSPSAFYNEN